MHEKTTVPNPPAATSGEQPLSKETNGSITEVSTKSKDRSEELFAKLQKMQDPDYLHTVTLDELYDSVYQGSPPIVEGLLWPGAYLFAGSPKVGKSFMVAQIAYHVSMGIDLWGFHTHQATVLYLALEDDYRRLQTRLYRMFGTEGTEKLHFAVRAKQLDEGLEGQLEKFLSEHPDTKLVIIDTLQKVRETGSDRYSYASDYVLIGKLKQFTEQHSVCLLLVHHTRKQQADDKFDMISGTNGLLGSADGAFLLRKEKRTDDTAVLEVSGRDQQDQRFYLKRDPERLVWELERAETELWKEPPDSVLLAVAEFITPDRSQWEGSATELCGILNQDMKPNALAMRLNVRAGKLLSEYHIRYESKRSHDGRKIKLCLENLKT